MKSEIPKNNREGSRRRLPGTDQRQRGWAERAGFSPWGSCVQQTFLKITKDMGGLNAARYGSSTLPNWHPACSMNGVEEPASRRRTRDTHWRSQEMTTGVCSRDPAKITVCRHHWVIENGIFYVRDVSYGEDRSHARLIGAAISAIRNLAISIIRKAAYPFMTDAWADISSHSDLGLSLLLI